LGSWGTYYPEEVIAKAESQMPLGIGFMGNGGIDYDNQALVKESQMPLGIGFMGNW